LLPAKPALSPQRLADELMRVIAKISGEQEDG
jgi:hypothetical protein